MPDLEPKLERSMLSNIHLHFIYVFIFKDFIDLSEIAQEREAAGRRGSRLPDEQGV